MTIRMATAKGINAVPRRSRGHFVQCANRPASLRTRFGSAQSGLVMALRLCAACWMLAILPGCSYLAEIEQRGEIHSQRVLRELQPGIHRRADVVAWLGSPTVVAPFDEKIWFYFGQTNYRYALIGSIPKERRVLRLTFDEQDLLRKVEEIGLDQANTVSPARRKTPSGGKDVSLWEQLVGNIGRFNSAPSDGR